MFNVFAFERKVKEDETARQDRDRHRRVMSVHKKMRDVLAENYQKRVASFIREMVDSPVRQNDDYTLRLTINTTKASDAKFKHFTSLVADNKQLTDLKSTERTGKLSPNYRYGHSTSKSISSSFQQPTRDFRYASFRTEKERIEATIRANQEF